MRREIRFEKVSENGKNRRLHIHLHHFSEDKVIGFCNIVYDKQSKSHEGIMVLTEVIDEMELNILTRDIQKSFLSSEVEDLFVQLYYGVFATLLCDESEETWNRVIK